MKEVNINTDLRFSVKGENILAAKNAKLIADRMSKILDVLTNVQNSSVMIENLRDIISHYKKLGEYIEILKKANDEATKLHNQLYGDGNDLS